jgi:membrane protease YdiL (CAAX protease family)
VTDEPRNKPVASLLHFLIFLAIITAVAGLGWLQAMQTRNAAPSHASAIPVYLSAAVLDWLLFFFCWRGVRKNGGTLRDIIGGRWPTVDAFFKDLLIAAAFWGATAGILWWLARPGMPFHSPESKIVAALLPQTPLEAAVWFSVCMTAGFCEEFVFRGYVQRQCAAYGRSVFAGVIGQAVIFGLGHAYQGPVQVASIILFGLFFGVLAAWVKSLRPGMMAHAWEDLWSGWLAAVLLR